MPDRHPDLLAALRELEDAHGGGAAPVDEDEHRRLAGRSPILDRGWSWQPELIRRRGAACAYVGRRVTPDRSGDGVTQRLDVTLRRQGDDAADTHRILRELLADVRSQGEPWRTEVWLRGASATDLVLADELGFRPARTLFVLRLVGDRMDPSRLHAATLASPLPPEVTVRAATEADLPALAGLLQAVYPSGARAWDVAALRLRRMSEWYRDEDVLAAFEPDGELSGINWVKRRDAVTGEIHNLAVRPGQQGQGLGPALLDLGLAHLGAVGCREVLLWVDAANGPALALYRSRGFAPAWDDVVLRMAPPVG
jgi:mycothiol synthase